MPEGQAGTAIEQQPDTIVRLERTDPREVPREVARPMVQLLIGEPLVAGDDGEAIGLGERLPFERVREATSRA